MVIYGGKEKANIETSEYHKLYCFHVLIQSGIIGVVMTTVVAYKRYTKVFSSCNRDSWLANNKCFLSTKQLDITKEMYNMIVIRQYLKVLIHITHIAKAVEYYIDYYSFIFLSLCSDP